MVMSLMLATAGATPLVGRRSVVFDRDDTAYMSVTPSTVPTSTRLGTFSVKFKTGRVAAGTLFSGEGGDKIGINANGEIVIEVEDVHTLSEICIDPTAWYHLVVGIDTTQGTAADRITVTLNGVGLSITPTTTQNYDFNFGANGLEQRIGRDDGANTDYWDGKIQEPTWVDGQNLAASNFGAFDVANPRVWVESAYGGTFGNNGFILFGTSTGALGRDSSGNGLNFTLTNIAAGDQSQDIIDDNHCTWNLWSDIDGTVLTVNEGGREANLAATEDRASGTQFFDPADTTGWYFEFLVDTESTALAVGIAEDHNDRGDTGIRADEWVVRSDTGNSINNDPTPETGTAYGVAFTDAAVVGVALKAGGLWFNIGGNWIDGDGADTSATVLAEINAAVDFTSAAFSSLTQFVTPFIKAITGTPRVHLRTEEDELTITAADRPTDYKTLKVKNMAEPDVSQPHLFFDVLTYIGDGTTSHAITGLGFTPDAVSCHENITGDPRQFFDSQRGTGINFSFAASANESPASNKLNSFDSGGFTLGNANRINENGKEYFSFCWRMAGTANHADIVLYTGTGATADVAHSLAKKPSMIITKVRNATQPWVVYADVPSLGAQNYVVISQNNIFTNDANSYDAEPDSSIINYGNAAVVNTSGKNYAAYVFCDRSGLSVAGEYDGTGDTSNCYVHTGFKPRFVTIRRIDGTGSFRHWDSLRQPHNNNNSARSSELESDNSEITTIVVHLLSNGFIVRETASEVNEQPAEFLFWAWAEAAVGSLALPCVTAR